MDTFFFGYLPIKTKRILRSLLFAGLLFWIIWGLFFSCTIRCFPNKTETLVIIVVYIVLTGIDSYILEPFTRYKK